MASYDPIIRMDENVFRAPGKIQSMVVRKPLGDVTNSSKPIEKNKSTAKNCNGIKAPDKVQAKTVRKPLGDLTKSTTTVRKPLGDVTNSTRPPAQEKTFKKTCAQNVSAVKELKVNSWVKEERFLHNHDYCMKAQSDSTTMNMDYFLETVGLKKDFATSLPTLQIPQVSMTSDHELEAPLEIAELDIPMIDICSPLASPRLKEPGSPCWNIDCMNLDFSPVKLKDSPVRI